MKGRRCPQRESGNRIMESCAACKKEAAFRQMVFWRNGAKRYRVSPEMNDK